MAYTTMEENAEAMINPDRKVQMMVHVKFTKGMAMAKGAAPRMPQMMSIEYTVPSIILGLPLILLPIDLKFIYSKLTF